MDRHHQIREALQQRSTKLSPAAFALGCAVWQIKQPRQTHAACVDELPRLVALEVRGQRARLEFLATRHHLRICSSCAKIYLELLELARLDAGDELPQPPLTRPPDFLFLDSTHG